MGDHHDHYLKKYILLLGNVFEKFIDTCLKYYKLNPCHYFSSPSKKHKNQSIDWCEIRKNFRH